MSVNQFLKNAKKIEEEHRNTRRTRKHSHAPAPHDDESNWLVSYADMMTLLCGFFIMLFSLSTIDQTKYEKAKESLSKEFHGKYDKPPAEELARFVSQVLQEAGVDKLTAVKFDPLGVSVMFQSSVFFDSSSAEVRDVGRPVLARLIDSLSSMSQKNAKKYRIVIEGHTDSRPVVGGVYASNWELSGARASRVLRMFQERGFDSDQLIAISYADTKPEAAARTPAGEWDEAALARNRRVVVRILEPSVEAIPIATPGGVGQPAPDPVKPLTTAPAAAPAAAPTEAPATQPSSSH
jgi:chemotaxis protein MotB